MHYVKMFAILITILHAQDSTEDDDSEEDTERGNCGCCCNGKAKKKSRLPGQQDDDSISNQLEERFKEHTYALSVKPRRENGGPIEVKVTLLIESITDVSEVNMDLTITFVIYQTWTDPRLMIATDKVPLKRRGHLYYTTLDLRDGSQIRLVYNNGKDSSNFVQQCARKNKC